MVAVETDGVVVRLRILGWHRLWAFKRELEVDLRNVVAVRPKDPGLRPPWLRRVGTAITGLIYAGVFRGRGRREFWDWSRGKGTIQMELADERYTRVVVSVDAPEETIRRIQGKA